MGRSQSEPISMRRLPRYAAMNDYMPCVKEAEFESESKLSHGGGDSGNFVLENDINYRDFQVKGDIDDGCTIAEEGPSYKFLTHTLAVMTADRMIKISCMLQSETIAHDKATVA